MSRRSVRIYGGVDGINDDEIAAVTGSELHVVGNDVNPTNNLGNGHVFTAFRFEGITAQLGTFEVLMRIGAFNVAWIPIFAVDSTFRARLFEGPTVTDPGTALALRNRNRASALVSGTTTFTEPTTSDPGEEILTILLPPQVTFVAAGAVMLAANTDYILRMENIGSFDAAASVQLVITDKNAT